MPRYNARRDDNDSDLFKAATKLGFWLTPMHEPVDYLGLYRGRWLVIEIKRPDKEGFVHEFTPAQKIFIGEAHQRGGRVHVWRTVDDVIATANEVGR